jgi:preprotein translocase subunit SecG
MQLVLLIVQIILAVILIGLVLIQKSSSDGLSGLSGGGGNLGVVSSRASANFLTKSTAVVMTLFMINCLILGNLAARTSKKASIVEQIKIEKQQKQKTEQDVSTAPLAE